MPEPLSALLIMRVGSDASSFKAACSNLERFGNIFLGCSRLISVFILFRYVSISAEARGGCLVLLGLKRWCCSGGWFLKKYFILLDHSNPVIALCSCVVFVFVVGMKDKPFIRTVLCMGVSCLEDRLVMYF